MYFWSFTERPCPSGGAIGGGPFGSAGYAVGDGPGGAAGGAAGGGAAVVGPGPGTGGDGANGTGTEPARPKHDPTNVNRRRGIDMAGTLPRDPRDGCHSVRWPTDGASKCRSSASSKPSTVNVVAVTSTRTPS